MYKKIEIEELLKIRLPLSKILEMIDFEYKIDEDTDKIYLIDLQNDYFIDITQDRFEVNENGIKSIIERLDTYWKNIIIYDTVLQLDLYELSDERYKNLKTYNDYLNFLINIHDESNGSFTNNILYLNNICNPDMIYFDPEIMD